MPIVCGVKFRGAGKVYYFSPGDIKDLQVNDLVIVETARGMEMGQMLMPLKEIDESEIVGQLKAILRRGTTADLLNAQRFQAQEAEAVNACKEQVDRYALPMKVTSAEYNYDGSRLTFFFTSEQRVDFRELVRELARLFKTRIELRQIGVRDEAKMCGGLGRCGRALCCATWLSEFSPVSIRMAKQQDLPLSPMEISGLCGRLLCCLSYENDYYQQVKGKFPKVGERIDTPYGLGKIIKVSVLTETVSILLEDGSSMELTAEQLSGEEPIPSRHDAQAGDSRVRVLGRAHPGALSPLDDDDFDDLEDFSEEEAPSRQESGSNRQSKARPPQPPSRPVVESRPKAQNTARGNAARGDAPRGAEEMLDDAEEEEEGRERGRRPRRRRPPAQQPGQAAEPKRDGNKNAPPQGDGAARGDAARGDAAQKDAAQKSKSKRRRPRRKKPSGSAEAGQPTDRPVSPAPAAD